jgi:hypothetical protein
MDADLAAARAKAAQGGSQAPGAALEEQMQQQQQEQAIAEQKKAMLLGIVDEDARARLARIAQVRACDDCLCVRARRGMQCSGGANQVLFVRVTATMRGWSPMMAIVEPHQAHQPSPTGNAHARSYR